MPQRQGFYAFLAHHYKRWWFILILTCLLTAGFYSLRNLSFFRDLEDKTLDARFRLAPIPERADTNIVMLAIDDNTLRFGRELQQGWPFPREFYGLVTDYLTVQGAKGIIFDMQFYEPDFDRADIDSDESDSRFAAAMANSGRVFLGTQFTNERTAIPDALRKQALTVKRWGLYNLQPWKGVQPPIPQYLDTSVCGIISVSEDREAIVRRMPLLYNLKEELYPNLALAAWLYTNKYQDTLVARRTYLAGDGFGIPVDRNGQYSINWYGNGGVKGVFKYYSMAAAMQSAAATLYGNGSPSLPSQLFKDKYVIIGATAAGLMDLKSSPYTWSVPGMEIWATILSNLNKQDFLHYAPGILNLLIIFVLVGLILGFVVGMRDRYSTIALPLLLALFIALGLGAFIAHRYVINMVIPVLSFIITWIFIVTVSYLMEGKHKKELRMVFSRYLHPDLVQRIVEQPDMIQMGGEEYHATVMFSDIYNFTGFSENKSPKELVSYLNAYFSSFTNSILDCKGLLDKYTGDGLMAVFGVPIARADHALLACQAALAHRDFALTLKNNKELSPSDHFHINTRLGINSGLLVAGNIGSERRMEYTSIGDTVNLSARLEGVNKVFHTNIIISEATYVQVKDTMLCRELDFLRVKGKKEPTRIYELIAEINKVNSTDYAWIQDYETALAHYRAGRWTDAEAGFSALAEGKLQDPPSTTMLSRTRYLMENPPLEWDGILTLEEK